MAVNAYPIHPSPILRGKLLIERVLCRELGVPIQGAEAALPPDILEANSTNRERTEVATSNEACASCHDFINPAGFALEHYDAMGMWRAEDNGEPVDASGTLELETGESLSFDDGVGLARALAMSEAGQDCYTRRWAEYATGLTLAEDDPDLLELQEHFRGDDDIKGLFEAITTSPLFVRRSRTADGHGGGQ